MNRKEFLANLGVGAAFVLSVPCFSGCTKDAVGETPEIDFTVSLDDFPSLNDIGNYIIQNDIVIANNLDGQLIAATVTCSHQNLRQIRYDKRFDNWQCTAHGAQYNQQGEGLNANGANGLEIFNVEKTGNSIRVFSKG